MAFQPSSINCRQFYIGGQWVEPVSRVLGKVINPATEEAIAEVPYGSPADIDRAIAAARKAFGSYGATSKAERLALLQRTLDIYKRRYEDFVQALPVEMGAPITLAREAQVYMGVAHLTETIKALQEYEFEEQRGTTRIVHEPIGVAGLITPWNWPLNQIAAKVAEALAIALPGAQRQRMGSTPTANLKAYDAYIRGDQLFSREGAIPTSLVRAAQLFTDAVTADPRFAVAFARLSLVHARLYEMFADHTPRRLELARQASDSALALDPSLPEGHLARGRFFEATDDLERAAAEYALAVKGKPNDSQILAAGAAVMARRGQWTESTNQFRRAAQLDPRSVQVNLDASVVYSFSRDYRTAMRYVEQAILADSGVIEPWITKGRLELFLLGDRARARETMRGIILRFGAERAASAEGFDFAPLVLDTADLNILARVPATAFGSDPLSYHFFRTQLFEAWQPARARAHADTVFMIAQDLVKRESNNFRVASGTAYMNAITGHRDVAISEMRRALQLTPSTRDRTAWSEVATMAMRVYTIVGENDAAIDQIEQLVTTPALMSAAFIRTEPRVASLRNSPRLQAILARAP